MPEQLDKRKKKILQAIIEEYIDTAEPVILLYPALPFRCSGRGLKMMFLSALLFRMGGNRSVQ